MPCLEQLRLDTRLVTGGQSTKQRQGLVWLTELAQTTSGGAWLWAMIIT